MEPYENGVGLAANLASKSFELDFLLPCIFLSIHMAFITSETKTQCLFGRHVQPLSTYQR